RLTLQREGASLYSELGSLAIPVEGLGDNGSLELLIRPSSIRLLAPEPSDETVARAGTDAVVIGAGHVDEVLFTGDTLSYVVRAGAQRIYGTLPRAWPQFKPGTSVAIVAEPAGMLLYQSGVLVKGMSERVRARSDTARTGAQ